MIINKELISKLSSLSSPSIIAISGFGGSGKTTVAERIGKEINAPVVGIDSFQKDGVFDTTYKLWEIMDFGKLEKEVLIPFSNNEKVIIYGNFNPRTKEIEKREIVNTGKLVVEGVGLFRPELLKYFNYKIWVDCPIEVAIERGKKRDRDNGSPVDALWEGIWKDNDLQYIEAFNSQSVSDIVLSNK